MKKENVKVRKAKKNNLKDISIIYKKIFSERPYNAKWTEKNLMRKMLEIFTKQKFYVAEINKKIVGFISFYDFIGSEGKIGYIFELGVDKNYRGREIGKMLMKKAEKELKKIKCTSIVLDVNKKSSAINFYRKLGYMDVGYIMMGRSIK